MKNCARSSSILVYLHDVINDLGRTLDDVFGDQEKRVDIEGVVLMNMAGVNELQDFVVRHGEQAELTLNVVNSAGDC